MGKSPRNPVILNFSELFAIKGLENSQVPCFIYRYFLKLGIQVSSVSIVSRLGGGEPSIRRSIPAAEA
jgi:hypothetical protein